MDLLVPLFSLIAPFLIWPVEIFLPYPFFVEEIVKAFLILLVLKNKDNSTNKLYSAILVGALFSFSETVLYIFNIYTYGGLSTFFERILVTMPMHIVTAVIIYFCALKDRRLIILGVMIAALVHYLFNQYVILL